MWLKLPNGGIMDLRGTVLTPAPKSDQIFVTMNVSVGIPAEQQQEILDRIFDYLTCASAANGELVGLVWYVESAGRHHVKQAKLLSYPG